MKRFRSMWGIGLCLGLAGCAGTQQRVVLGPGNEPVARTAAAHPSCGCAGQRPALPWANPLPPVAAVASRPPSPPPVPSARFFPLLDEHDGAAVDPLENPRVDFLGVRTVQGNKAGATPTLRDMAMQKASTEEPLPPVLPLVLRVPAPQDLPEGTRPQAPAAVSPEFDPSSATQGLELLQGGAPAPVEEPIARAPVEAEPTAAPAPVSPGRGAAIALEYADEGALAGRPRLGNDGTVIPGPSSGGDPIRYGPDPTYPAAYYAGGSAPTSVPKNREVWPVSRPWRPTLLPRVWQRIRDAVSGGNTAPAPSVVGEPRDVAERGR